MGECSEFSKTLLFVFARIMIKKQCLGLSDTSFPVSFDV